MYIFWRNRIYPNCVQHSFHFRNLSPNLDRPHNVKHVTMIQKSQNDVISQHFDEINSRVICWIWYNVKHVTSHPLVCKNTELHETKSFLISHFAIFSRIDLISIGFRFASNQEWSRYFCVLFLFFYRILENFVLQKSLDGQTHTQI